MNTNMYSDFILPILQLNKAACKSKIDLYFPNYGDFFPT